VQFNRIQRRVHPYVGITHIHVVLGWRDATSREPHVPSHFLHDGLKVRPRRSGFISRSLLSTRILEIYIFHQLKHDTTGINMSDPKYGSPAFKKAFTESRSLKQQPTNDELLEVWPHLLHSISFACFTL